MSSGTHLKAVEPAPLCSFHEAHPEKALIKPCTRQGCAIVGGYAEVLAAVRAISKISEDLGVAVLEVEGLDRGFMGDTTNCGGHYASVVAIAALAGRAQAGLEELEERLLPDRRRLAAVESEE